MSAPRLSIALPKANADPFAAAQKAAAVKVQKAQAALPAKPRVVVRPLVKANQGLKQSLESVARTAGGAKLRAPAPSAVDQTIQTVQAAGHSVLYGSGKSNARKYPALEAARKRQQATVVAPVLNVLNQTTRPIHAIAGGVDAAITGKPVGRAIARGIENKDHTTFSKVLKDVGAPKALQGVGGFVGDVALDPTTYATFGTGSIARKALIDAADGAAAKAAVREAAPSGLTIKLAGHEVPGVRRATGNTAGRLVMKGGQTKQAQAVRNIAADVNPNIAPAGVSKYAHQQATSIARTQRAAISTAQRAAQASGVALKKAIGPDSQRVIDAVEAGKVSELPAHLRDAAQHMTATQDALHAREHAAGIESDTVGAHVPHVVPELPDREATLAALKVAQRERVKAEVAHKVILSSHDVARGRAQVLSRTVGGASAERAAEKDVRYAAGGLGVRQAADAIAASGRRVAAARKAVGDAQAAHDATLGVRKQARKLTLQNERLAAEPKGYIPHFTTESLQAGKPSVVMVGGKRGVGKATVRIVSQNARSAGRNKPLSLLRVEHPGAYSEDLPLLHANRQIVGETGIANAQANARLAELGRPYSEHNIPGDNEGVFKLDGTNLTEVTDPQLLARARKGYTQGGKSFVVLDKRIVAKGRDERKALSHGEGVGKFFDRNTGRFKRVATFTPGFHVRNLIGDTQNAYLAQPAYRMPGNLVRSGKTLKALKRTEEAQRTLGATAKPVSGGGVRVAGKQMTYEALAHEAASVGAIRAGFQNREISDLLHPVQGAVKKISDAPRIGRAVKRTAQSREDLPRLSTYIQARRQGMNPEAAARYVAEHHFDYANLTNFERNVARRVMPFYTFSARNIPLQTRKLVQKPGKAAAIQKVREEAAIAAGLKPGYESGETPADQRNAGIPVKIGGKVYNLSAGLPITDLNETPGANGLNPIKQAGEYIDKGLQLGNPLLKAPVELGKNISLYTGKPLKDKTHLLSPAPAIVGSLPGSIKKLLGATQALDKHTGKQVWMWDPYTNYVAHSVPGLPALALGAATAAASVTGKSLSNQAIGAAGVKATPLDPQAAALNVLYQELGAVNDKLGILSKKGIVGATSTPARAALNAKVRDLNAAIYQLKVKRGDKILPKAGAPAQGWGGGTWGAPSAGTGWGGPVSSSATSAGWGPQPKAAGSAAGNGGWGP